MNQSLKKKVVAISIAVLYLATVVSVVLASATYMKSSFYNYVFVSGSSMEPTLNGGGSSEAKPPYINADGYHKGSMVHFGLTDSSKKAINNVKRYDILTVYYPNTFMNGTSDYDADGNLLPNADYKIKRLIAFPGETFKIVEGELYVLEGDTFVKQPRSYSIRDDGNVTVKDVPTTTLKENEYWVMGDHRSGSTDCASKNGSRFNGPIFHNNIVGVLVCIQGLAEFFYEYSCEECHHKIDEMEYLTKQFEGHTITTCPDCGGNIEKKGDIRNREFTYPRIV